MKRLVEIRSYKLKPGSTAAFQQALVTAAVPLLREWGTDVVAFGSSPHEADAHYLIRSYASLEDLQSRQDAFYGSDAWRKGPRESIVSLIESYLNTVLWLPPSSIDDLRQSQSPT